METPDQKVPVVNSAVGIRQQQMEIGERDGAEQMRPAVASTSNAAMQQQPVRAAAKPTRLPPPTGGGARSAAAGGGSGGEQITIKMPPNQAFFLAELPQADTDEIQFDVKLVAGNDVYLAHKVTLAAASSLLATLLADIPRTETAVIHLPECDENAIAMLLVMLYTGSFNECYKKDIKKMKKLALLLGVDEDLIRRIEYIDYIPPPAAAHNNDAAAAVGVDCNGVSSSQPHHQVKTERGRQQGDDDAEGETGAELQPSTDQHNQTSYDGWEQDDVIFIHDESGSVENYKPFDDRCIYNLNSPAPSTGTAGGSSPASSSSGFGSGPDSHPSPPPAPPPSAADDPMQAIPPPFYHESPRHDMAGPSGSATGNGSSDFFAQPSTSSSRPTYAGFYANNQQQQQPDLRDVDYLRSGTPAPPVLDREFYPSQRGDVTPAKSDIVLRTQPPDLSPYYGNSSSNNSGWQTPQITNVRGGYESSFVADRSVAGQQQQQQAQYFQPSQQQQQQHQYSNPAHSPVRPVRLNRNSMDGESRSSWAVVNNRPSTSSSSPQRNGTALKRPKTLKDAEADMLRIKRERAELNSSNAGSQEQQQQSERDGEGGDGGGEPLTKLYLCKSICGAMFRSEEMFNYHTEMFNRIGDYACDVCHHSGFQSLHAVVIHKRVHTALQPGMMQCGHCGREFAKRNATSHLKSHSTESFQCRRCRKEYKTAGGFKKHQESGKCSIFGR